MSVPNFNWEIHAGDTILSVLGVVAVTFLRKITAMLTAHVEKIDTIADVVDEHSRDLVKLGGKARKYQRVGSRPVTKVIEYIEGN